ncbi:MAG: hypothetical protein KKF41_07905 [Actinobacteria bacterium]|nr:hypothetical protein [Actinomycetota bacterium]MBU1944175.1 hypothetical protein [Actinomycetota bacterium]MBU2687494.1 hypothetical protein [Actinomycetota bacterium]
MEVLVVYESFTGNTRFAVDVVRAVLERLSGMSAPSRGRAVSGAGRASTAARERRC